MTNEIRTVTITYRASFTSPGWHTLQLVECDKFINDLLLFISRNFASFVEFTCSVYLELDFIDRF